MGFDCLPLLFFSVSYSEVHTPSCRVRVSALPEYKFEACAHESPDDGRETARRLECHLPFRTTTPTTTTVEIEQDYLSGRLLRRWLHHTIGLLLF
jgi:hypothetical protein